jgi:REP element-mobilizing transposase RayT
MFEALGCSTVRLDCCVNHTHLLILEVMLDSPHKLILAAAWRQALQQYKRKLQ